MLATEGGKPFTDPDWIFEIKWDGYRTLARAGGGQPVELRTRNGTDCTRWYPEVARALAALPGGPHVIDGEACVLDDVGRSDFNALHARAARRRGYPGAPQVTLMAFDLLVQDGRSIMALPLAERKERLAQLLVSLPKIGVLYVSDFPAQADLFAQVVLGAKLEGFIAKRLASPYQPGVVSRDWMKIKRAGWQEGRTWKA
jgi:bifunctional non-homologous end joining protein LigD